MSEIRGNGKKIRDSFFERKAQGAASGNANAVKFEKTQGEDMRISFLMYARHILMSHETCLLIARTL